MTHALNFATIDPPPARARPVRVDAAVWWLDDAGHLCIGFSRARRLPLRAGRDEFDLIMTLSQPPAGPASEERLKRDALQAVQRVGPLARRLTSQTGVAAVYRESGGRLRGSFRVLARQQVMSLLGEWGPGESVLLLGEFEARCQPKEGPTIAARVSAAWNAHPRGAPPTTQPVGEVGSNRP